MSERGEENKKWVHDVRGKLASILLYIELLEKNYSMKSDKNSEIVTHIKSAVKEINTLLSEKK